MRAKMSKKDPFLPRPFRFPGLEGGYPFRVSVRNRCDRIIRRIQSRFYRVVVPCIGCVVTSQIQVFLGLRQPLQPIRVRIRESCRLPSIIDGHKRLLRALFSKSAGLLGGELPDEIVEYGHSTKDIGL